MARLRLITKLMSSLILSGIALLPASGGRADDIPSLGAIVNHDHKAIRVRSKPVIERLPVKVIEPIDLVLSDAGSVFVADRKAECVFRLDQQGSVSLMIERLSGIERIQLDADNSLYILTSTGGESALHQVTSSGQHVVLQAFSFPAHSFVRDDVGRFVLAVKRSGRIVSMSPEGDIADVAQLTQSALDLTFNAGGQLEALLPSGHVVRIAADGTSDTSGFAQMGSTRLASLEDGTLLTLAGSVSGRSQVVHVSRDVVRPEHFEIMANVPVGTQSVGFDSLGNLCLANADLRAVTRVTSQFEIPCPHCGKSTRMIFSSEPDPAAGTDSRSF